MERKEDVVGSRVDATPDRFEFCAESEDEVEEKEGVVDEAAVCCTGPRFLSVAGAGAASSRNGSEAGAGLAGEFVQRPQRPPSEVFARGVSPRAGRCVRSRPPTRVRQIVVATPHQIRRRARSVEVSLATGCSLISRTRHATVETVPC